MVEHHTINKCDVELIIMSDDINEIALKIDEQLILHTNELKNDGLENTSYYKQAMKFLSNKRC